MRLTSIISSTKCSFIYLFEDWSLIQHNYMTTLLWLSTYSTTENVLRGRPGLTNNKCLRQKQKLFYSLQNTRFTIKWPVLNEWYHELDVFTLLKYALSVYLICWYICFPRTLLKHGDKGDKHSLNHCLWLSLLRETHHNT